ncbi:general odorant-binding protein 83a-like isoform X1 [Neodiprion fabricii]|uniref:general odorant-binding protein 83a-like isoform X1 n=1 Tax=Neodiprion fabricii TaxID=2872261 RepID=UPI001ED97AA6|nr:general odorant-binding protein 83a-like isoform X1 [Neodiprion fabricii]XP_046431777.1 general odorant-binding protein 83a-like isoform X1 [Neodiprion fabricii]
MNRTHGYIRGDREIDGRSVTIRIITIDRTTGGLTDEQKAKLKSYKQACIAESGVEPSVVENAKQGQIAEDDDKLACFAACYLRHIGVYDAEGNVHEDVFRAKLPADVPKAKADEVVNKCSGLTGSTLCRTGAKLLKCMMESRILAVL